jgi:uncharacterized membrane protein
MPCVNPSNNVFFKFIMQITSNFFFKKKSLRNRLKDFDDYIRTGQGLGLRAAYRMFTGLIVPVHRWFRLH